MGLIRTTYETFTAESVADGEADERGWVDEEGTEYTVAEAIDLLKGSEASSSAFHIGVWYTHYGDHDQAENNSYHLDLASWDEDDLYTIYRSVVGED